MRAAVGWAILSPARLLAAGQMAGDKIACPTEFFSGAVSSEREMVFAVDRMLRMAAQNGTSPTKGVDMGLGPAPG
ncbi:MAG TPA: hypothetical protein VGG72_24975 [Bryobacteraceae bacterium]